MTSWKEMIREDEEAILHRDPAAKSLLEVRLCYPGLKALKAHRRANVLYRKGHTLLARIRRELRSTPARRSDAGCSSTTVTA